MYHTCYPCANLYGRPLATTSNQSQAGFAWPRPSILAKCSLDTAFVWIGYVLTMITVLSYHSAQKTTWAAFHLPAPHAESCAHVENRDAPAYGYACAPFGVPPLWTRRSFHKRMMGTAQTDVSPLKVPSPIPNRRLAYCSR